MISAIILAAGESRRMGRQKLLLPFGAKSVIEHIVDQVIHSNVSQTIVVTGHDKDGVVDSLRGLAVTVTHNSHYAEGMLTSIRCGLSCVRDDATGFMVVLGDQPSITSELVNAVVLGHEAAPDKIIIPYINDDSGHPIVVPASYIDEVMTSFDDTGLRGLIYGRPEIVHRLAVSDPGVLRDMDTPEDYERELRLTLDAGDS